MQRTWNGKTGIVIIGLLMVAILGHGEGAPAVAAVRRHHPIVMKNKRATPRFDLAAFQGKVKQAVTDLEKVRQGRPDRRVPFGDLAQLAITGDEKVMRHLRPVLEHTKPDVYEIARAITPVLISLQDKKEVDFPRTELLFAAAAHLLADERQDQALQ